MIWYDGGTRVGRLVGMVVGRRVGGIVGSWVITRVGRRVGASVEHRQEEGRETIFQEMGRLIYHFGCLQADACTFCPPVHG